MTTWVIEQFSRGRWVRIADFDDRREAVDCLASLEALPFNQATSFAPAPDFRIRRARA